jgi:predicted lactoylglutathione lyase
LRSACARCSLAACSDCRKSAHRREQVDELTERALAAGAESLGEPQDDGFMYMRGFLDLDGHQWSFIHMDPAALPAG